MLHFSEDPTITVFAPHVALTAVHEVALVWAVDGPRCPDYWFPRDCPRAMAWVEPSTAPADAERILGPGGGHRVHAIEYSWLARVQSVRLYAYRLPAQPFAPVSEADPYAVVARETVTPLGRPQPVGDLLELHRVDGIQLRLLDNLWPFWDQVVTTTMGFSGIRLRNAAPRP